MTTENLAHEEMAAEANALVGGQSAAIEELMLEAEEAPEPGLAVGDVVHRPSVETPFGMTIDEIEGAGWRIVYDRLTGDQSVVLSYMLRAQLEKTDKDGQRMFTTRDPGIRPKKGTLPCILHEDHPDREHHASLGFLPCRAGSLMTPLDVITHAQHRHQREWQVLERERTNVIEEEERQVRRAIIGRSAGTPVVAPVEEEELVPEITTFVTHDEQPEPVPTVWKACKVCQERVHAESKRTMGVRMAHHVRDNHPK